MTTHHLPDGSSFGIASFPLPADHWLYAEGHEPPPMPYRVGTDDPARELWASNIRQAGQWAIRAATMNGASPDWDPDALIQNLVVAMLGYWTPDGLGDEPWMNP